MYVNNKGARRPRVAAVHARRIDMALYDVLGWVVSFTVGGSIWETIVRLLGLLAVVFIIVLFLVNPLHPNNAYLPLKLHYISL